MNDAAAEQRRIPYATFELPPVKRVVVFAPHADDEVFGCGGTLARLAASGARVRVIIVTDGALGGVAHGDGLVSERQRESEAAAKVLGYLVPENWGWPDRGIRFGEVLIRRILAELADTDLVFAPHPGELHPDHQVLALACFDALQRHDGPTQLAFYEISSPLEPNALVDISSVAGAKLQAMRCFTSQLAEQRYDERMVALNCFRTYTLPPGVVAAEAFVWVTTDQLGLGLARLCPGSSSQRKALGLAIAGEDLPLVSVILRVSGATRLCELLESLRQQSYPNLELVFVDLSGVLSGDRLPEPRGRFLLTLVNLGGRPVDRASAGNLGLAAAEGRFVMFIDDHSILLPDHIEKLLGCLAVNRTAIAAYTEFGRTEDQNSLIKNQCVPRPAAAGSFSADYPIDAILMRRDAVDCKSVPFRLGLSGNADHGFLTQLIQVGSFSFCPGVSVRIDQPDTGLPNTGNKLQCQEQKSGLNFFSRLRNQFRALK